MTSEPHGTTVYDLSINVEELPDGGDYRYLATSPDLPGLIVAGDSIEEVLTLAPQVGAALIASLKASGDPMPASLRTIPSTPFACRVLIPV